MHSYKSIGLADIDVGLPLPWDVKDSMGNLLLHKGYIIQSLSQAETLIERGMYIDASQSTARSSANSPPSKAEPPSVLRNINLAVKKLDYVLKHIQELPNVREKILEIVNLIKASILLNEDLALATIMVNQSSGTYPVRHCVDTAILSILVASAMNKTEQEIQDIAAAALTMNTSMIALQEQLQKKKRELSPEERTQIKHHPLATIETLYEAGIEDVNWLRYVQVHHEHEDGSGYPLGAKNEQIPQNAKIISLADGFCARIVGRGDKKSNLPGQALRDIFIEYKSHIDTTMGAVFVKVLGLYPPGTFVMLKNQEVAVIALRGAGPTASVAYSLVNAKNQVMSTPLKRDTSIEPYLIHEALHPIQASVSFSLQQVWGPLASL